jgi:hypothetical protein
LKQHTENLVKRLEFQFKEIETFNNDKLQKLLKKVEVANILVQELQTYVARYKLIATEKEQIIYFKFCFPLIKKWAIAYEFIYEIEKNTLFGTPDMKMTYYKQAIQKLNSSYKSKIKEFTFIRQNDKQFESITLISSNLNNDIIALFEAHFIAEKYLLTIIEGLKEISNINPVDSSKNEAGYYKWAKSKTDLAELCYALFYGNCVTDLSTQKRIQLTKLITVLELAFGSDLKDYKRLFSDIKKRRINDSFTSYLQKTIQHQIEIHFG